MLDPERNDVNVSRLFHWGNKFNIVDKYGKLVTHVYIRLVGDSDINKARTFALRKSSDLRKLLKTPGTDEREAFISSIYEVEEAEDIIKLLRSLYTRQVAQEATKTVRIPLPKEPKSDSSLEEQEIYQAQVDTYKERRDDAVTEYVMKRLDQIEAELATKPVDVLQRRYEKMMVDELCEREMITKFREFCIYQSVYSDEKFKYRFFETFEDFENLPTDIKDQYEAYYDSLELNVDELKKLLGVTQ